ncbi:MAG: type IV fimbrial bioproteinis protein FimT [Gallionellaceae bacterium]|nr:MAG: type IV fimbrial bioproteinis protein FimT [Gallionellaceae bacterium]
MKSACTHRKSSGFTGIELLVTLVIAAILAALAVPSFSSLVNDTRLSSTMARLAADLNRARSEAIKRNMRVLVCVRDAAGTNCGAGTDWSNGWLVCYDGNQGEPGPLQSKWHSGRGRRGNIDAKWYVGRGADKNGEHRGNRQYLQAIGE